MLILFVFSCTNQTKKVKYPYQNSSLPIEKRINDLLEKMTIEEKIRQMDMYWGKEVANMRGHDAASYSEEKVSAILGDAGIGSIHDFYPLSAEITNQIQKYAVKKTRLGIPILFIEEGLHGYCGHGSTTFPVPLQLASAWDTTLVRKVGHVIGMESRAHGIHMILGPVLDLARDARWGRVEETYGEDPFSSIKCCSYCEGMQGNDLTDPGAVIAEPKHFAVHGIPEAETIKLRYLWENASSFHFLYPFEKAVREGGAKGIMAAYHELDGIPCVSISGY